jgi:phosphoglycolate phosphatase-like HAD superfamily hydrolase
VIITGNSCRVVEKFLDAYQMGQVFETILCAEDPGSRLEKMRAVKNQFQPTNGEIFMIGDAVSDIRAAREAGVISIAVTWGHQSKSRLSEAGPDVLIDQPSRLLEFFVSKSSS